ncbi:MAG TPA: hypothetical protein VK674_04750 [Candidatus Limnocylindria bacterium]|nr:hypothetical protein [Candidatus Limnocylindria bacterium]
MSFFGDNLPYDLDPEGYTEEDRQIDILASITAGFRDAHTGSQLPHLGAHEQQERLVQGTRQVLQGLEQTAEFGFNPRVLFHVQEQLGALGPVHAAALEGGLQDEYPSAVTAISSYLEDQQ